MRYYHYLIIGLGGIAVFLWAPYVYAQTLDQNAYRFYVNKDAVQPDDPWPLGVIDLGENTPITSADSPPAEGDTIRIRMSIAVSDAALSAGATFKLQWGEGTTCSAIGAWTDVAVAGAGGIWRGFDNATPTDGATVTSLLLAPSDNAETYEESNPSAATPTAINVTEDGEWDWVIQHNGAAQNTSYCFRMVYGNGTVLDSYLDYPKLRTKPYTPVSQKWRWYRDIANETPSDPLMAEVVQGQGILPGYAVKLRLAVKENASATGTNIKMKVQYDTASDFSSAADVTELGSCTTASLWCYANGTDADNAAIITRVLSDTAASATHNESGVSVSTFTHAANAVAEWEFTLQASDAISVGTTYYLRAYDVTNGQAVTTGAGQTYPSMIGGNHTLSFSVGGLAEGTSTEGVVLDATSTATTLPFGTVAPTILREVAHRLTVTTDAFWGYKVYIRSSDANFQTGDANIIQPINGTNGAPVSWVFFILDQKGAFGYHAGDDVLSGASPTRFAANDSWAKITTSGNEIVYSSGPVAAEITDIVYRTEISALQENGSYALQDLDYIVVPFY